MSRSPAERAWLGSSRIFAAELLIFPTGLVTAGVLSRTLGAETYGVFALVATIVGWLQATANSMTARAAHRTLARRTQWRPAAAEIVRLQLQVGLGLGILVVLGAGQIAAILKQPAIVTPLRLLALDLPLVAFASAYRSILVGIEDHHARAMASAIRWIVRMLAVVTFVKLGWSLTGAVAGLLLTSVVELAFARYRVGPLPRADRSEIASVRAELMKLALPVAIAAIVTRLMDRADLFLLSAFGAATSTLGHYGAAQSLTMGVSLLTMSISPVVLATITRCELTGDHAGADQMKDDALRLPWVLFAFAGLAAGSAPEIMRLIFGEAFVPAAAPFSLLIIASTCMLCVSATATLLVTANRPWIVVVVNTPMLVLLGISGAWLIPRLGGTGAALAMFISTATGALFALGLAVFYTKRPWPLRTMLLGPGLGLAAGTVARAFPASAAVIIIAKLLLLSTLLIAGLVLLGVVHLDQLRLLVGRPARGGRTFP
jgi:O-antigen/teichoic acid export membrane protein